MTLNKLLQFTSKAFPLTRAPGSSYRWTPGRPYQLKQSLPSSTRSCSKRSAASQAAGMSETPVKDTMELKITEQLQPTRLNLIDKSHKHAGHAAMKGLNRAETHFNLSVVSQAFEGLTTVKRHKLVYKVLSEELAGPVHALSLKTLTPAEAG